MNVNSAFTPDYAVATGLLQHLNSEELKELLNDEEKLDNMIKDLQQVKNMEAEKEMSIASNKSIAEYNLSLKPTLDESRITVTSLYSRASDLKNIVTDKREKLSRKKSQQSLGSILAILQAKTAEVEEETEAYIEKLLASEVSVDEFLSLFLTTRTKVHILHTKVDKMAAILQNPNAPSQQPLKPIRSKKAPPPPPRPLAPIQAPINPFITPNPFPPLPRPPGNTVQFDHRAIVPTRIAPRPPMTHQLPLQNTQQMASAFSSMGIYASPNVPIIPQPYLQVNMPKKY